MFGLGPHAIFIVASYGAVVATITVLIGWLVFDGKRHQRRLADLDEKGLGRAQRLGQAGPVLGTSARDESLRS